MGLFDFFKRKHPAPDFHEIQTIYFKSGQLYKVTGKDENNWYDADILISDGTTFDLRNAESIRNIPIPDFQDRDAFEGYGTTGSLDYVLRMKAGAYFNRKEKELCSACLWKSTELMLSHRLWWRKQDYDRIVKWHYDLGMISEAEKAKTWLSQQKAYTENTFDACAKSILDNTLEQSKIYNFDLVAFHDYGGGCCGECAKYRGRVYSISGRSRTFPVLPAYVKENGNFHPGCRCMMTAYFDDGEIFYKGERTDAIKASTRPWDDDRTEREKALYQDYLDKIANAAAESEARERDRAEYQRILSCIPDITPKSFGSYRRMKNARSANFMKLAEVAKENGIEIQFDG